jgi:hypothetical protein
MFETTNQMGLLQIDFHGRKSRRYEFSYDPSAVVLSRVN